MAIRWGLAVALIVAGCTPQEARFASKDDPGLEMGDQDANVDIGKAKVLIEQAVAALRDGKLEDARRFLSEAEKFADEMKREEAREVRQSIDSAEADKYVPNVKKLAEEGKCEEAVDTAVEVIEGKKGGAIPVFVRDRANKSLLDCLLGQLKIDLSIGRELADSDKVKKTLKKNALQQFQKAVTDAMVEELISQFETPIAERRWIDAKALLDELVQKKEAGDREFNRIMGIIRKGIAKDINEKVREALSDKKGVSDALTEVDRLIEVADYGKTAGKSLKGTVPTEVKLDRDTLALWKVCADFSCTMVSPKQNWMYGHGDLHAPLSPKDKPKTKVRHATRVWRLAESRGWVLIADQKKKPKSIDSVSARVGVASGWVKSAAIKGSDTAAWLPPGESIVGTRVWGPLRKGQKELELGSVIKLKGAKVAVERLSDRNIVEVPLRQVRFGTISKGTKILARCRHPIKLEAAVIAKVKFPAKGDPTVKYTCAEGGEKRDDQLGSVRAKSGDLPARK